MRLLVAEDEKRLNKIICEALEDEGYSVDACFDGEQALEYARAAEYDAMIMDIMMPRLDGLEAVRQMRTSVRRCCFSPRATALPTAWRGSRAAGTITS